MKILMFLLPVIIAGAVLGLGMAGVVQIPGISPKKKATAVKKEEKAKAPAVKAESKGSSQEDEPTPTAGDPSKGHAAVAKLWNEMEVDKLIDLTEKWKDDELAPILRKMDTDKVVELLGKLDGPRAASLTRIIQKLAETEAS